LPNQFAAPAATIQTLVTGMVSTHLPSQERWIKAYTNNTELCAVWNLVVNPSLITNQALSTVNHNYCGPLHQSLISVEDDMLILRKLISGMSPFTCLQLVPSKLINIIFIAFHTNPVGGHLNAYRTLHCLHLCFYWPGMHAYVKRMCQACLGWALFNPTCGKSSKLVYNFLIEAPFLVMSFDASAAGKHASYEGSKCYLIGCCSMCGFASMEPITKLSATAFALAIMQIILEKTFY
jgi:hypothetical protein